MKPLLLTILICLPLIVFAQDTVLVIKVTAADTLELAGGQRVRLIGIDTTEEAYEFTKEMVEGKPVRLEFDVQQRDEDGRLLAYVHVKTRFNEEIGDYDDDFSKEIFLNAEIIKKGYAKAVSVSPNVKYADLFQKLYQQAREK